MGYEWEGEVVLQAEEAFALIEAQFPKLKPSSIQLLEVGWFNCAFLIDEKWVFKFPKNAQAAKFLERELLLLPIISSKLPLPVPVPQWEGAPAADFPWKFIGYEQLPGITARKADLSEEERGATAEPLGHFLAKLHAIPLTEVDPTYSSPPKELTFAIDRKPLELVIEQHLQELGRLGLITNQKQLREVVEIAFHLRFFPKIALIHNDFHMGHLLVNSRRQLSGVIDWANAQFDETANDLSIAHILLPKHAHATFREAYGPISEERWAFAKFSAVYVSLLTCLCAHQSKDALLLKESIRALKDIP